MIFAFGDVELDTAAFELRRAGAVVDVEPQVFDVLVLLVTRRDRMVTKEELLDEVWGDRFVSESALTSRIRAARRAVGDDGRHQGVIRTVHGRGYRFVAPVDEATAAGAPATDRAAPPPPPRTRYARSDHGSIAYQVAGTGPGDLVFIPGFVSNIDLQWEFPPMAAFFGRLARAARLIVFDKRGTGLSDRVPTTEAFPLEERMDDVAVRCGHALLRTAAHLDPPLRIGVHTTEVERLGHDIAGLGVHIGAQVAATATPGEVWVTRTVRDLVAGSGLRLDPRGTHRFDGLDEPWPLYAARPAGAPAPPS